LKIVSISDTHGYHRRIKEIPDADVLIHAGDITGRGEIHILQDFGEWLKELPHAHKIIIAGNHDFSLEREGSQKKEIIKFFKECGVTYLQDSSVEIDGVLFYGAPWQPEFYNWAFNLPRGKALAEKWAMIPDNVNVLITHGPPYQILDEAPRGVFQVENIGCKDLLERALELTHLRAHVFGHCHNGAGVFEDYGVKYINSCICNEKYQPINPPRIFEI